MKHTNHATQGDTGKYFFFDRDAFDDMVGNDAWDGSTFAIRQNGSQYWNGTVKVWRGLDIGAHGRRDSGKASGQWAANDRITLGGCGRYTK